ncbi:MAG: hypothetical protein ABI765_02350 [Gemmatimonadota bacterium]
MSMTIRAAAAVTWVGLIGMAGCKSPDGPEVARVVSTLYENAILAPDTVKARTPFVATIAASRSTCDHPDGSTVSIVGSTADVTIFLERPVQGVCILLDTLDLRTVVIGFPLAGTGVIRARSHTDSGDVFQEKSIVVTP